jgi:uncharacterized protein (DUF983 family)
MSQFDEYFVGEKSIYCKGVLFVVGLICVVLLFTINQYYQFAEWYAAFVGLAIVTIICICMQVRETQIKSKQMPELEPVEPA